MIKAVALVGLQIPGYKVRIANPDQPGFRTIARNENQQAMKDYHAKNKSLKGFEYTFQPDTWMEGLYHSQMKYNMQLNLNVYTPTRQFFNYTLPRWYYPNLYPGYNGE